MRERMVKFRVTQKDVERIRCVAYGKELQQGNHGGQALIFRFVFRHPLSAVSAFVLPAEGEGGFEEYAVALGTILLSLAVVVECATLVVEGFVALQEE